MSGYHITGLIICIASPNNASFLVKFPPNKNYHHHLLLLGDFFPLNKNDEMPHLFNSLTGPLGFITASRIPQRRWISTLTSTTMKFFQIYQGLNPPERLEDHQDVFFLGTQRRNEVFFWLVNQKMGERQVPGWVIS